jgi:hemolysin activation/secretion protein
MKTVIALGALALIPAATLAQDVGRQLNWQTPSDPNYRPTPEPAEEPYQLPELPAPRNTAQPDLSRAPQLFVKSIEVAGATVLDAKEIAAVTAPYTNRQVTSGELQTLRLALSRLYVDKGYVSSGVLLPDQQVRDGRIRYEAVEGKLTRVEMQPDSHLGSGYVVPRLRNRIDDGPLHIGEVQNALNALQQDPNVKRLDARLLPGERPGESVLAVRVDDAPRFHFGIGSDNHRATSTGAERLTAFAGVRNLTGYGDQLNVTAGVSDGSDDGSVSFSMPISSRDANVQAFYSRSDSAVIEERFEALDIESKSTSWGLTAAFPLLRPGNKQFTLSLGFQSNESTSYLLGMPFSFSPGAIDGVAKTSVAQLGLDWSARGQNAVTALRMTYKRGLDLLDATVYDPANYPNPEDAPLYNPTQAGAEFGAVQAQAIYLQRTKWLGPNAQFVFRLTSQIAQDSLMSLEKISIGGVNTVRGYPENLMVRDNGVAASVEFQIPVSKHFGTPHPANLTVVPFFDYGRSWDKLDTDPGNDLRNTDEARFITSAGLGLKWNPFRGLDAQVYWGTQLSDNFDGDDPRELRNETDLQDDGVHYSLMYTLRW